MASTPTETAIKVDNLQVLAGGLHPLISDVNLHLDTSQRVLFIGSNGSGKSTLLAQIEAAVSSKISNSSSYTSGSPAGPETTSAERRAINYNRRLRFGFFSGRIEADPGLFARQYILEAVSDLTAIEQRLRQLETDYSAETADQYQQLMSEFQLRGGDEYRGLIRRFLDAFGIDHQDLDRPLSTFSGGQQIRLALARTLLMKPDVLVLDEPTTHLDIFGVLEVERYLAGFNGALILVSHDSSLWRLDFDYTWEIIQQRLEVFRGGYQKYLTQRDALYERRCKDYQQYQDRRAKLIDFIDKNRVGQRSREAQSRIKVLQKLEAVAPPPPFRPRSQLHLPADYIKVPPGGQVSLEIKNLNFSYQKNQPILENIDLTVTQGQKLVFLGRNGTGKSTLVKILARQLIPDGGRILPGVGIKIGWFSQGRGNFDPERRLIDIMHYELYNADLPTLRSFLALFGFRGEDIEKTAGQLSMGEMTRFKLAYLLWQRTNLVLLDEPTDNLDPETRQILAQFITEFPGTLLVVTHDRELIERCRGNPVLYLENCRLKKFDLGYEEFLRYISSSGNSNSANSAKSAATTAAAAAAAAVSPAELSKNERFRLNNRLGELEAEIENLETEAARLEEIIASPQSLTTADGRVDSEKYAEISGQIYPGVQRQLEESLKSWEEIAGRLEE